MSIVDIINRIRREPPYADPEEVEMFAEKRYICKVFEAESWERATVEERLGVGIPPELNEFWTTCGGLVLYEDNLHRQWGLVLLGPLHEELQILNEAYRRDWTDSVMPGDLIIGKFWGDRDRPMIRCDKEAADYGSVIIVEDTDPREEWCMVGVSLEEFLRQFMESRTRKFWSYHYRKEQAEKAAQQKP